MNPQHTRALLLETLLEAADKEELTPDMLRSAANGQGVSVRTIRRWVASRTIPGHEQPRYEATQADLEAFGEARGRYRQAWEKRRRDDPSVPSLSTWSRALRRATSRAERAYAKGGELAKRASSLYLPVEAPCRNAVWEADHKELDVWVMPARGSEPGRPWMTTYLDAYSRAVMGFALSPPVPDSGTCIAALHAAVGHLPERGPFRGVPEQLHFDNGRDWLSDAFMQVLTQVGAHPVPVSPYAPHRKGKIERFHGTLVDDFLSQLTFFTGGPRRASGLQYWPNLDPPLITEFFGELDAYVRRYNSERPHSSLGGATPLAVWTGDSTRLRERRQADLALLLPSQTRKVQTDGVHFEGETFVDAQLHALVGEEVEVRYRPHDSHLVYVFFDGAFVCAAKPRHEYTGEERRRFLEARKASAERMTQLRRKATAKARPRLEPLTKPGQKARDTRLVTKNDRRRRRRETEERPRLSAEARRLVEGNRDG